MQDRRQRAWAPVQKRFRARSKGTLAKNLCTKSALTYKNPLPVIKIKHEVGKENI
jgi:hypothetical protein